MHATPATGRSLHPRRPDGHADLARTFGLLWLNPPYGDLTKDANGNIGYQGQGRARLEKLFYQRALPLLQYGGVLVFIVPSYVLDAELVGWLTRHFADLRIYRAVETQFKQVVIFGRRVRQRDRHRIRSRPRAVCCCGSGKATPKPRNCRWNGPFLPYASPSPPSRSTSIA